MDITHKNSRTIRTLLNLASQSIKRFATQNYGYLFFTYSSFKFFSLLLLQTTFSRAVFYIRHNFMVWIFEVAARKETWHRIAKKIIAKYEGKSGKYSSRLTPLIKVLVFFQLHEKYERRKWIKLPFSCQGCLTAVSCCAEDRKWVFYISVTPKSLHNPD